MWKKNKSNNNFWWLGDKDGRTNEDAIVTNSFYHSKEWRKTRK